MSDDIERVVGDLVVPLTNVLRDLRVHLQRDFDLYGVVEQVCAEHGVEIDWSAAPVEQDEEDRTDDHG